MHLEKALFDELTAQPTRAPGAKPLRPRHAATLILVRRDRDGPKVLMGQRRASLTFMGGKWVFPGGRVDRADYAAAAATDLNAEQERRLSLALNRGAPPRLGRALAMAAVRETFEEAGLLLARPAPPRPGAGAWRDFFAQGALPDLEALTFIARAVTPPYRPRRFDARFFMADADRLLSQERGADCGELDQIAWIGIDDTAGIDLPAVTRFVLSEARARLADPDRFPPMIRLRHGAPKLDQLRD